MPPPRPAEGTSDQPQPGQQKMLGDAPTAVRRLSSGMTAQLPPGGAFGLRPESLRRVRRDAAGLVRGAFDHHLAATVLTKHFSGQVPGITGTDRQDERAAR